METLRLYTTKELSEQLHVRPETIRQWVKDGKIESQRIGRKHLFRMSDVLRALNEDLRSYE